jgi:hypothetical protein
MEGTTMELGAILSLNEVFNWWRDGTAYMYVCREYIATLGRQKGQPACRRDSPLGGRPHQSSLTLERLLSEVTFPVWIPF